MSTKNKSYLATIFVIVISLFPRLGKKLWLKWYDYLAKNDKNNDFTFMNYGYSTGDSESHLELKPCDEANRLQIQLYDSVISELDLNNLSVLEVGSGRGGGLDYISRYKNISSAIGIDLSTQAVTKSNDMFASNKLEFINGDAESLPINDSDIDVVINVESSHCYPDMDAFIKETYRVLKPGGYLAICDIRNTNGVVKMESSFNKCGYTLIKKSLITDNVIRALDAMTNERIEISTRMPSLFKKAFKDFSGVKKTSVYEMLKSKKLIYVSYILKK